MRKWSSEEANSRDDYNSGGSVRRENSKFKKALGYFDKIRTIFLTFVTFLQVSWCLSCAATKNGGEKVWGPRSCQKLSLAPRWDLNFQVFFFVRGLIPRLIPAALVSSGSFDEYAVTELGTCPLCCFDGLILSLLFPALWKCRGHFFRKMFDVLVICNIRFLRFIELGILISR